MQARFGHPFLFLGDGDGELLAALATASPDHFTAVGGAHTFAETVRTLPALSVWLISPLHFVLRFPRYGHGELTFQMGAVNDRSRNATFPSSGVVIRPCACAAKKVGSKPGTRTSEKLTSRSFVHTVEKMPSRCNFSVGEAGSSSGPARPVRRRICGTLAGAVPFPSEI